MNRDRFHQPSPYWTCHVKHHQCCDVAGDIWPQMDPNSDWSLRRDRWTETRQDDDYYRDEARYRDDVPGYSTQRPYNVSPIDSYHPQVRHIRPQIHSQNSVPSFMEYQGRVAPVHNPGPRCTSQPGYQTRMYEQRVARPDHNEAPSPIERRVSENEFSSDMDLSLFVAATSGFTPESPVHRSFGDAPTWPGQPQQRTEYTRQPQRPGYIRSHSSHTTSTPLVQAPIPSYSTPHLPIRQPQPRSLALSRQGPNAWQERLEAEPQAWPLHDYGDNPPPADELPDYEQSQAEMQNKNRIEAMRRAEELQRRWRSRHSR